MNIRLSRRIKVLPRKTICGLSILLCSTLSMVACATVPTTTTVKQVNGQVQLADSQLGESYEFVLARASQELGVEPQCEERKIALRNQRKSFLYDTCGYLPDKRQFADAPLAEVVYHFIDRELVRVDVRAEGDGKLVDTIRRDMDSVFTKEKASSRKINDHSYEWFASEQVAGVRLGTGANEGFVHVRLFESSLVRSVPWLAEE